MGFFAVEAEGTESLVEDMNNAIKKLRNPIWSGLSAAADEMVANLRAHIQVDVYDVYNPKSYPRRSEHTHFGFPLTDSRYMTTKLNMLSLQFSYEPKGYHTGRMQDALDAYEESVNGTISPSKRTNERWNDPLKPHPVHGDALIRRIQTGEGYDWKQPKGEDSFPKRPFWDNFVNDQKNGALIDAFAFGFSRTNSDLLLEGGRQDIEWGATEGMIEDGAWEEDFDPELELPL